MAGKYAYILGFVWILVSCTEPIDLDLNTGENIRLVVDAEIDNLEAADTIYLTYTTNFFEEGGPLPATGGAVTVARGDSTFTFTELGASGKYYSPEGFVGRENFEHRLAIAIDGATYTATSFMKPQITIDTLTSVFVEGEGPFSDEGYRIGISFQDPPGQRDYYWFIDYVNGFNEYTNVFEYGALFNDEIVNGRYLNNIEYGTFDLEPNDTLTVDLRVIDKQVETIVSAIGFESFDSGLFDGTPSNVPTNISGNALGLFTAYSVSRRSVVIQP